MNGLSVAERVALEERVERRRYRSGVVVANPESAPQGFLVEKGSVRTMRHSMTGTELLVGLWGPGHCVGTASLTTGVHPLTIEAAVDSVLLAFGRDDYEAWLTSAPTLAARLADALAREVLWLSAVVDRVLTTSVKARVAQTLLALAGLERSEGFGDVRLLEHATVMGLARMVLADRREVAKVLEDFEAVRLIRRASRRVIVIDPHGLAVLGMEDEGGPRRRAPEAAGTAARRRVADGR